MARVTVRKCEVCGEEFEAKRRDSRFCSRKCGKRAENIQNADKYRERAKKWHEENREHALERNRKYYHDNIERMRERSREYNRTHWAKRRAADKIYKDKTRHGGKREELLKENGGVCSECGKQCEDLFQIVAHHVSGDNQDHERQVLLCRSCHCKLHHWKENKE